MAVAETANLLVKLTLGGNYASQLSKVSRATAKFDRESSRAFKAGQQIGTGIKRGAVLAAAGVGILATQVALGLDSLIELEKQTAQTNAVLKSTRSVAGQTAASIRALAEKYEALNATIGDEVIQSGANLLLTFTNIKGKAFEPALAAALDLSVALGTDLNSAIKTVGKALSDPAKAMGRLARQGIILTESEEKQIKAHLKNNDALGAQEVVLKALNERYGGSFLAGGATTAGKVAKFNDAIEDLQRSLAVALLPTVSNVADALTELLADPEVQRGAEELGKSIASLFTKENIKAGIGAIKEGAGFLLTVAQAVGGIVKTAVGVFTSLPPEIQKLAVAAFTVNKLTGGLVTNLAGGLISAVISSFKGLMNVNAAVVNVNGPVGGLPGGGKGGGGIVGKVAGAAAGAAGFGLLTVSVLAIAPAVIAGLGLAITKATDPTGARAAEGKSKIAEARGIPAWNNKALNELNQIKQNTRDLDRPRTSGPAAEKQRQAVEKVQTQVENMKGKMAQDLARNKQATDAAGAKAAEAGRVAAAAIREKDLSIRQAINVEVNVSAAGVSKSVTVQNRYGPGNGSAGGGGPMGDGGGAFGGR